MCLKYFLHVSYSVRALFDCSRTLFKAFSGSLEVAVGCHILSNAMLSGSGVRFGH